MREIRRLTPHEFLDLYLELSEYDVFYNVLVDASAVSNLSLDEIREVFIKHGVSADILPDSKAVEEALLAVETRAML